MCNCTENVINSYNCNYDSIIGIGLAILFFFDANGNGNRNCEILKMAKSESRLIPIKKIGILCVIFQGLFNDTKIVQIYTKSLYGVFG